MWQYSSFQDLILEPNDKWYVTALLVESETGEVCYKTLKFSQAVEPNEQEIASAAQPFIDEVNELAGSPEE